ncbi:MAG: response regulator [Elusimicrobiota bacterium]
MVKQSEIKTILVVEDDAGVRSFVFRTLTWAGYTTLAAANSADAIRAITKHDKKIHLILIDIIMPGIKGISMITRLVKKCPRSKFMLMTDWDESARAKLPRMPAGLATFHKPFTPNELVDKVRSLLN